MDGWQGNCNSLVRDTAVEWGARLAAGVTFLSATESHCYFGEKSGESGDLYDNGASIYRQACDKYGMRVQPTVYGPDAAAGVVRFLCDPELNMHCMVMHEPVSLGCCQGWQLASPLLCVRVL